MRIDEKKVGWYHLIFTNNGSTWLMSEKPASFCLSFIAGFVDTAGFIALGGIFTAHVTGNLVLAGAAFLQGAEGGTLARLLMIPVFIVAVALSTGLSRYSRRRKLAVVPVLLTCQTLALAVFLGVGLALMPARLSPPALHETTLIVVGACGVIAMGIQNTLMREGLSSLLPTTVMTGNLTQFTIDLVCLCNRLLCSDDARRADRSRIAKKVQRYCYVLCGFVGGAIGGAYGIATWHFWCILVPFLLTMLLTLASFSNTTTEKE
jgi:uncharacterized membrane protein YoaK (UPF0700 family)